MGRLDGCPGSGILGEAGLGGAPFLAFLHTAPEALACIAGKPRDRFIDGFSPG
jgi:hypothetical protein